MCSYAGLVSSKHSPGGTRGQSSGGFTKTGNGHLQLILVETAWYLEKRPGISAALHKRRQSQEPRILASAATRPISDCIANSEEWSAAGGLTANLLSL